MSKDNAIQVFNHPQFGSINTVETENGKVLFRANDVAKALGYVETAKAVRTHCKGVSILPMRISLVRLSCNPPSTFRKRMFTVW